MSPRISIRLLATQSDQRLVALARDGHERAFEALVHRYRRPLLRYARRMRLSEARAEDVLQQAFMQSWIALSGGASVNDVRSWLYRIVHNVAVNAMRGPAGEAHGELTQAVQDRAGLAGVSNLERAIAMRDTLSDVAALPRMQQQAIFLTAVDGQSHDEVAGVLGISEGALRGLLYRARSTLRSAAAALIPPPLIAWASAGAGSGGPTAERLAELSGGGAAGIAGLLFKGAVVAVTAGAVATGTSVLSVHHRARPDAAPAQGARDASSGLVASAGSLAFASDSQIRRLAGRPGAERERSGIGRHGRHGRHGSAEETTHRHGGGSGARGGESIQGGGDDAFASDDGSGRSSGSTARDGSGSESSGSGSGRRDSGSGSTSGGGQGSSGQGSTDGGSSGTGSGGSGATLADSSGSPSSAPTASVTGDTSDVAQPTVAGTEGEVATTSGDSQSGKDGGGG